MITNIANLETDSINDWLNLFKEVATEFQNTRSGITPIASPSAKRYSMPDYNIWRSTINISDSTSVLTYRPLENDTIVSDVITGSPISSGATFSYTYSTLSFRTRESPKALLKTPLESPRMFILHSRDVNLKNGRQVNDAGQRVIAKKLFMNLLIDTDDNSAKPFGMTGTLLKNSMMGLAKQVLERPENLLWLFEQGYEDIKIQPISYFSPEEEGRIGVYRAMLMVAMNVYPLPF